MELLRKKVTYENKQGKVQTAYNFYLKLDNGYLIPIKNTFKEGYLPLVFNAKNLDEKKEG